MNNAEIIYGTMEAAMLHSGVKGMKWGVRKAIYRSSLDTAIDTAKDAKDYHETANKLEGTNGSMLRRAVSSPVRSQARQKMSDSNSQAQATYYKASKALTKARSKVDPNDKETLAEIDKLHRELQSKMLEQQKVSRSVDSMNAKHKQEVRKNVYGDYGNGANIGLADASREKEYNSRVKFAKAAAKLALSSMG